MSYGDAKLVGEWTLEKLAFLETYLPSYTNATKKAGKNIILMVLLVMVNGLRKTQMNKYAVQSKSL